MCPYTYILVYSFFSALICYPTYFYKNFLPFSLITLFLSFLYTSSFIVPSFLIYVQASFILTSIYSVVNKTAKSILRYTARILLTLKRMPQSIPQSLITSGTKKRGINQNVNLNISLCEINEPYCRVPAQPFHSEK